MVTPSANAFINENSTFLDGAAAVFDNTTDSFMLGAPLTDLVAFTEDYPEAPTDTWSGIDFQAYTTPTNPYTRDRNDKAVVNGRFTLVSVGISIADTGGLTVEVSTANGSYVTKDFNGRIVGRASNLIGRQPIVTTSVPATICKEVRECSYTIKAKTWLPLTVTAIEYTGQVFNNTRRV